MYLGQIPANSINTLQLFHPTLSVATGLGSGEIVAIVFGVAGVLFGVSAIVFAIFVYKKFKSSKRYVSL